MSSSSFPLLRLPSLALKEIIDQIGIKEQFKLSLCSKRMYYNVKYFRVKPTLSLKLYCLGLCFKGKTEIRFLNQKSLEKIVTFGVGEEGDIYYWETGKISFFDDTERIFSHGNDVIEGTKFLVEFLCDLFAAKVEEVSVIDNKIWMLDFIEKRQGGYSYDATVCHNTEWTDEQSKQILLDLNPRSLVFEQEKSNKFRIENFDKKYESLEIHGGTWMTVENLCQLDCVKIEINHTDFSNTEINRYFKHVLSGGAPRLREFRAKVQHPTENVIMDGIRELWTEIERFEDEEGNWNVIGKVARGEELVLVSIKRERDTRLRGFPLVSNVSSFYLEIKET